MNKKYKIFDEMNLHLLNDDKPSFFFKSIDDNEILHMFPYKMIFSLKEVKQSPKYHPEGNVFNHTMLVIDEAAKQKNHSSDSRVFMWAALLHDIGKGVTTKIRKSKITAYNHDIEGAKMTVEFLNEFEVEPFISQVSSLVRWHMQILYITKSMQFADIKAMKTDVDINDIALLGLCDRLGRGDVDKKSENQKICEFIEKINSYERKTEMNRLHLSVDGIGNNQSKTALKNALGELDGVQMVNIDLARGSVEVGYNEPANETSIRNCIKNTGF